MIGKFGKANLTKQIICSKTKNMKKQLLVSVSILTFVLIQMCPSFLFSQAPQAFKYQSIIRNINGTPMSNTNIGIRASVHEGSATGLSVYQESHASTTNQFGLINLEIGNGTSITGNFSSIAWSTGTKWMEIEADFGSGYISMGTSQLLSVPFALNFVPGPAGENGTNGVDGLNGTNGVDGIDGATGQTGSISQFAMFFGLTAGTGNGAGTDYSSTIAVKSGAGTGRFPFPQDGPTAGIARVNTTSFTLPTIGTYEIYFSVHTTEAGQIQLELDGVDLPETVAANMNATAGGHLITGTFFVTTSLPNAILAVINPSGNAAALTITPADGASTHANAQVLTIKKIF